MTDTEKAIAICREIAIEAATYCHEAADAINESVRQDRNNSIDWGDLAKRRLRAALALLGG